MQISANIAKQLRRHNPANSFPPVGYDPETGIIFLEDTTKRSYLGATFIGHPISGFNDQMMEKYKTVMSASFPAGTFVQIHLLSVPDIEVDVFRYIYPKRAAHERNTHIPQAQRDLLLEAAEQRAQFFLDSRTKPHIASTGIKTHRILLAFSIKIPTQVQPTEREVVAARESIAKFESGLMTCGFSIERANAGGYLSFLRLIFNPWCREDTDYDEEQELRTQMLPPGYTIDYSNTKQLQLGDVGARILSVNRYPKRASIAFMSLIPGDPGGINNQFPIPWLATLTIHYPDRENKRKWFNGKHRALMLQAQGQSARFVPRLLAKKLSFDGLAQEMENGDPLVEFSFNITMFSPDQEDLTKYSSQMSTYLSGFGMELAEDSEILWPIFWNNLPLFPSDTSIQGMNRFRSQQLRAALQFSPILSDWTGTGSAAMLFETRRGIPFAYDLFDSQTNYNALIFAESGAGKSVLLNSIISDYLALGAKIWVVDRGRSYFKLAKAYDGEFIVFNENSNICLNPFTYVVDIDDEMDLLKALVAKMASPNEGLNDYQLARLQEAIKAVWGRLGNSMTITEVADYLSVQDDDRVKDLGSMLFAFTRNGQFGHWFDGEANLKFHANFIVLELEELSQKEHLQQIVLTILMSKIQHEMYLMKKSNNSIKRLAIFDEAWALFSDPGVANFLNHGFRRFRKYDSAGLVAVQNIGDFYLHPQMEAVAQNAATRFILQQMPEAIDLAVESGKLALDDFGVQQLKGVHTIRDQYSEIMIHTGRGYAVTRLVLPEFAQVMYSTTGDARNVIIDAIESGVPAIDAIHDFIESRRL